MLPAIELTTGHAVEAAVIWLHGLGADGGDFVDIVDELRLPLAIRFVFPHAPIRPVTLNGGYPMRAWYDLYALDLASGEDREGILQAQAQLFELIDREIARGIPASKIVLAGFSQGGAVALQAGLRYPEGLAGIMALSTYLPLSATLADEAHPANSATRIFMAHGDADDIIRLVSAENSRDLLQRLGYPVKWALYPMAHQVCREEIDDIANWLAWVLSEKK